MNGKWEPVLGPMGTPQRRVNPITGTPNVRTVPFGGGNASAYNGPFKAGGRAKSKGQGLFNPRRRSGGPFG